MKTGEFDLIAEIRALAATKFSRPPRTDVVLGIGDDCALLQVPANELLAVSTDTLVSGVHFFEDVDPASLGHKALAVNLSDLAAMGAKPLWFTLNLTLPRVELAFLRPMLDSLVALAAEQDCCLVGGDTTRGPVAISISVFGSVPNRLALRRSGAEPDDDIYVSGALGAAAAAVKFRKSQRLPDPRWAHALDWPQARTTLGLRLRAIATAAIDLSDGLSSDLAHLCQASGVSAVLDADAIPVSSALTPGFSREHAQTLALSGGDDYELCFTANPAKREMIDHLASELSIDLSRVGQIVSEHPQPVRMFAHGKEIAIETGFRHF